MTDVFSDVPKLSNLKVSVCFLFQFAFASVCFFEGLMGDSLMHFLSVSNTYESTGSCKIGARGAPENLDIPEITHHVPGPGSA